MRINKFIALALMAVASLGLGSCEEDDAPKGTFEPGIKADYYFEGSLNGSQLSLPEGESNYISTTGASKVAATNGCWQTQDIVLRKETSDKNSIKVSFIKKFTNCPTQCTDLESMLQAGKHPFGKVATSGTDAVEGVVVTFVDAEGTVWRSDKGSAKQQGSVFMVNSFGDNTKDSQSAKVIEANFNCNLYDGTGRQIMLSNGEIVSRSLDCSKL